MTYVVENTVPIPTDRRTKDGFNKSAFFRNMAIGESFLIPDAVPTSKDVYTWRQTARSNGGAVEIRSVEGGCRVWRVK
jgi:hypothetical protein